MIDYTTLKHQADGTPTWDAFLGIILKVAVERQNWQSSELIQRTLEEANLPQSMLQMRYPQKSHDLVMRNRVSFALSDLAISGLLDRPERGLYLPTSRGQELSKEYGINITRTLIHNEPAYKKYKQEKSNQKKNRQKRENKDLVESQIKEWFNQQNEKTQDELLNHLVKMNPYKFENLMVQLLSVMGYKGDEGQALVTQKSNDHGIDGIINQDPLGLQKVYLQVKRYAPDNSVQMPEITAFSGSIKLKHADRGVFITTSTFTQGAINAAKDLNITLVNGEMLTNLMIQYQVGVEVKEHYMTYKIDGNLF